MNEKLYELFDLARKGAAHAKDAAASAAYTANQVGTELLANAKVRMKIVELESQVNAGLRDLGKLLYATHVGTPVASEVMMEKLEEIDRLNAELEVLKGGIAKENPAPSCPTCCAAIQEGDEFCRECGGKL